MSITFRQVAHRPLVILNASRPGAWEEVGGMTLTARTLFHLQRLKLDKIILIPDPDSRSLGSKERQGNLQWVQAGLKPCSPSALILLTGQEKDLLYIDTAHLMDPRILDALSAASGTTIAYLDPADRKKEVIRAAFLTAEALGLWADRGTAALMEHAASLFPQEMETFSPEIRGASAPYFMAVESREEARRATRVLIRSQQKQVLDLPSEFIHPPLENALTLLLCNTRVTPNMVTFSCVAVAIGVAFLFWYGHLIEGAFMAFFVGILDGVDGKLARTKLRYTKIGEYEHVIDYFYENSWYVALAVGLQQKVSSSLPAVLAGLLIFSDTLDNVFYTLADRWYGKSIDLFSPFDARFRRVAGRRNIYVFIFLAGFLIGYPFETFAVAALWGALTAGIHGLRLLSGGKGQEKVAGSGAS